MIRSVRTSDAGAICTIYNHFVKHTVVTFEEEPVTTSEMENRIKEISMRFPYIVLELDGTIKGYAYATTWKTRASYRFSVETTVYLEPGTEGNGYGFALYSHLIDLLKQQNIHSVIGGISLPNHASIRLHEKCGFKYLGKFSEVGYKFNNWVDVGYWELIL
ncbi:arsinothricin resistance N-acetyltransferase ArsN1 family B [Saccharicrinis sp. FJH62]|uniref:arsinothricin resistance N-acetyltransferase ArsN1 family B n=1 Tax=Saccharicrinis sp. FJH62 TaxID=3344657 RepID=UPI0035D4DCE4